MNEHKLPDNWDALPVKDVTTGGTRRKVKYDQQKNIVYLLDEHGDWTGEAGQAPARPATNAEGQEDGTEEKKEIRRPPKAKSKSTPIFIAIIVVLCVLLVLQNSSGSVSTQKQYSVIIAMENIQPGEALKGKKLSAHSISMEEYYQYAASGGLYLESEYKNIENYYATSFIPKDGYLSYTNIGESFQATNPWTLSGASTTITIPIDATLDSLSQFIWGNEINLTVVARSVVETNKYPNAYRPESPEIEGSSSLQSVQIDTYKLNGFTIVDVLNDQKRSLYSTYASLAAIPKLYQEDCLNARYASGNQVQSDIPAYIKIAVSKETAEWWEKIANKRYTVTVTIDIIGVNCETSYQNETYQAMKAMLPILKSAWAEALAED